MSPDFESLADVLVWLNANADRIDDLLNEFAEELTDDEDSDVGEELTLGPRSGAVALMTPPSANYPTQK